MEAKFEVGKVDVFAETDKGHSPEFWAESATRRILGTSYGHLGPHVEEQAKAFRERLKGEIYRAIIGALRSDRQTIAGDLRKDGMEVLASQLLAYRIR